MKISCSIVMTVKNNLKDSVPPEHPNHCLHLFYRDTIPPESRVTLAKHNLKTGKTIIETATDIRLTEICSRGTISP